MSLPERTRQNRTVGPEHELEEAMSFQAYLDNVEKNTGRTPQQLIDEVGERGLTTHRDLVAWLKQAYSLGAGHAQAISQVIRKGSEFEVRHTTGAHRDTSGTLRLSGIGT